MMTVNALELAYEAAIKGCCDVVEFDFERCNARVDLGKNRRVSMDDMEYTFINTVTERKEWLMGDIVQQCWNRLYRRELLINNNVRFSENIIYEEFYFIEKICRLLK